MTPVSSSSGRSSRIPSWGVHETGRLRGARVRPGDGSLWSADDNTHRLYELDKDTGALKRVISQQELAAAPRLGVGDLAGLDTASDFEAMAYDAANDTLYVFAGKCCFAHIRAAVFRLVRDGNGVFQVESFQPLAAPLNDFSGAGVVGSAIWVSLADVIHEYDYATNTVGGGFTIPGVVGPVLGISDADGGDVWVTNRDTLYRVDRSTERSTRATCSNSTRSACATPGRSPS